MLFVLGSACRILYHLAVDKIQLVMYIPFNTIFVVFSSTIHAATRDITLWIPSLFQI